MKSKLITEQAKPGFKRQYTNVRGGTDYKGGDTPRNFNVSTFASTPSDVQREKAAEIMQTNIDNQNSYNFGFKTFADIKKEEEEEK